MRPILSFALAFLLAAACTTPDQGGTLTILHTNDIHSRLQPVNRLNATCSTRDEEAQGCFGGSARLAAAIAQERAEAKQQGRSVLLLDAGDQFQGSLFYTQYRGDAERQVMNMIGYQAMAVGNHEFDNGPPILAAFIRKASFPVLSANFDPSRNKDLAGLVKPYQVLSTKIGKIGIIGATTEDTPMMSSSGSTITFHMPEKVLPTLIDKLKTEGVSKIILLSHIGLARDRDVASRVSGLDLIVGGHSHTLLSNNQTEALGPYPVIVKAPDGRNVPIVQTGAYGRNLGRIDLEFNALGDVIAFRGDTIPLIQSLPEDPKVKTLVSKLAEPLETLRKMPVGEAQAALSNTTCRMRECHIGNLVTEAMLDVTKDQGVVAVITNGGGLRSGIQEGIITMGDVLTVLPFQNSIATLTLQGRDLWAVLEHGLSGLDQGQGRFPQVAGIRYTFDAGQPVGRRLQKVEISSPDGGYYPLDNERHYRIATNDFMRRGGDGYTLLQERAIDPYDFGASLDHALVTLLRKRGPITPLLDDRIVRKN